MYSQYLLPSDDAACDVEVVEGVDDVEEDVLFLLECRSASEEVFLLVGDVAFLEPPRFVSIQDSVAVIH